MKSLKDLTGDSLEQMIDYQVVDQNGDEIGSLHSLWSDPDTGSVEFLGVKTGWLFGHNHVVPAEKAEYDEANNVVRLPYTAAFIKEAPAMSAESEISEAEEQNIYRYYDITRSGTPAPDSTEAPYPDPAVAGSSMGLSNVAEAAGSAGLASIGSTTDEAAPFSAVDTNSSRLRRTTRPEETGGESLPTGGTDVADSVSGVSSASVSPDTTRDQLPTSAPAATYPTANLYGSTGNSSVPTAVATPATTGIPQDTSTTGPAGTGASLAGGTDLETYNALSESVGSSAGPVSQVRTETGNSNPDPITGEPGSHPVGTGVGALTLGAVGAALGSAVGGPIGAPVGAAAAAGLAGAVGGGYAGKSVAEVVNPTDENTYWQSNYRNAPYYQNDYGFEDYEPAYRVGYEGYGRNAASGRDYPEVESELESDYSRSRGSSRLTWEQAKSATRAAWDRLKAGDSDAR